MADFDTAVKRWSGLAWAAGLRFNPIPDGAFGAADRQTLLGRYAGIEWGEVEPPAPSPSPAPAPPFTGISGGGGMSNVPRKHPATIQAEEWEEAERERITRDDEMVLDCITALVAAGVL